LAPHYATRRLTPRTTPVRLDQLGVLVLVTAPGLHRRTGPRLVLLTPLPRTRLLLNLTADGFWQRVGVADYAVTVKAPFRTDERVEHEDLDAGSGRWPLFAAAAIKADFLSAFALPLRLRDRAIGALNWLSTSHVPMDEADVIVARAFADLATLTIVQLRANAEAQRLNEQLSAALTSRVVIEQAKGVICERAGIGLDEAFSRLRATPATTTPPHRRGPGRHRRHPRSASMGTPAPV
jgi:GAF domain-containing protein